MQDDNFDFALTTPNDVYIYPLEGGPLVIETDEETLTLQPSDSIWVPDGTWHHYRLKGKARAVVTAYPVNWREMSNVDM